MNKKQEFNSLIMNRVIASSDPVSDRTSDQILKDINEFYPKWVKDKKSIDDEYFLRSRDPINNWYPSDNAVYSVPFRFEDEFKKAYGYIPILTSV